MLKEVLTKYKQEIPLLQLRRATVTHCITTNLFAIKSTRKPKIGAQLTPMRTTVMIAKLKKMFMLQSWYPPNALPLGRQMASYFAVDILSVV